MENIIKALSKANATPYLVGGCVRDKLFNKDNKDIDIEVFGIEPLSLADILKQFGKVNVIDANSFGVIKLKTDDGEDYDFSLPRRDNKSGSGYRGFDIEIDHTMSLEEASTRRDFTINAMYYNLITDEIVDIHNGKADAENKILKAVSNKFKEDPLRVLRGFQFSGRFDLDTHPDTIELCHSLKNEYQHLSKERIWVEWQKWAEKSQTPSKGLEFLLQTQWIEFYPELTKLINCPQNPQWHPEGDVWTHTKMVCDEAVRIAQENNLNDEQRMLLVLASLCHDLGKPAMTKLIDNKITSRGHEKAGVEPAETFLKRINCPQKYINQIKELTEFHLVHADPKFVQSKKAVRRLVSKMKHTTIKDLTLLMEADTSGRSPLPKQKPANAITLLNTAQELNLAESQTIEPIVTGKDLIALGLKPSKEFKRILDCCFNAQLDGIISDHSNGLLFAEKIVAQEQDTSYEPF